MEMDASSGAKALFDENKFYIVQTNDLREDAAEPVGYYSSICSSRVSMTDNAQLEQLLREHGAQQVYRGFTCDKIPWDDVTHIISRTHDFPAYQEARDKLKNVVKPDWVKASVTKGRLAQPRQYSPDPKLFFSGLVVCCADLPSGDSDAIIGGVLAMGGLYSSAVSKMVTHIVALTTEPDKCQAALNKNLKCKIILPHWFVVLVVALYTNDELRMNRFDDCLKLGKRIDEGPYCLPNPEILHKRPEDRIADAGRQDLQGASSPRPTRLPTPSSSPSINRRQLSVFRDKHVMLSNDLALGSRLLETIEDLISSGGGRVTGSVHKADILICQYRDSLDYRIASRSRKDVGNLAWLYFLITHNAWTSPMRRLLHYPVARDGLPGFGRFRISLSNYNGEARVYLESLAKAAGGEFTKTMKEDNTHLITAHQVSEKCDAAKEWNVHMVNHLWLEESYAKWSIQTVSNPRYTTFPARTNLGEVVGQTPIDREAVERVFFPEGSDIDTSVEGDAGPRPMSVRDQNIMPSKISNIRNAHPTKPAKAQDMPFRGSQSDEATPKGVKADRRHTDGAYRTPAAARFVGAGKENETPSTTGSRSAKDKAVARLQDMAPDIALFEKERKRVGGVTHGKDRRSSEEQGLDGSRKRSISKDEDTDTGIEEIPRESKKPKKSKSRAPPAMRLALTGYRRWVGAAKKEAEERVSPCSSMFSL